MIYNNQTPNQRAIDILMIKDELKILQGQKKRTQPNKKEVKMSVFILLPIYIILLLLGFVVLPILLCSAIFSV